MAQVVHCIVFIYLAAQLSVLRVSVIFLCAGPRRLRALIHRPFKMTGYEHHDDTAPPSLGRGQLASCRTWSTLAPLLRLAHNSTFLHRGSRWVVPCPHIEPVRTLTFPLVEKKSKARNKHPPWSLYVVAERILRGHGHGSKENPKKKVNGPRSL